MKTYIIAFIELQWYFLNKEDYKDFKQEFEYEPSYSYITFQASDFLRYLKSKKINVLPNIIDLESFDKQMSQEGKELNKNKEWKVLRYLRFYNIIDNDFKLTNENIKQFLEKIAESYEFILSNKVEEVTRFETIEKEICKIIHKRQYNGIRIKKDSIEKKCIELEESIYSIKNKLQLDYNIFTPDDISTQYNYLTTNGYSIIGSMLNTFKIYRDNDEVSRLFYELIRNNQDNNSLLLILAHWGGKERCYPSFHGFGTITSRITLRNPCLQSLRKSNRDIIIPDQNKKLLYIDYSQFEAGILASLSGDKKLIQLYDIDIYEDIATKLLDNKHLRDKAKILFYRFMYGDKSLNKKTLEYFNSFTQLNKFKKEIEQKLSQDKKIGYNYGNFRRANTEDNNWALSHVIQSTASYIYKSALIRADNEVKEADFLIPMHDGTVYQIDDSIYDATKEKIEAIYINVFKEICPQINPKVNSSNIFK